jgi:hypothetical protein
MDDLLKMELYNLFQGDKVLTWENLLKTMSGTFSRNRDEVFEGMTQLINDGRLIVTPNGNTHIYCRPGTLAKIQKEKAENLEWKRRFPDAKEMTRERFDQMTPQEKMEFSVNDGRIVNSSAAL